MKIHVNFSSFLLGGVTAFGIFAIWMFFNGKIGDTGQSELNDSLFVVCMVFASLIGFCCLCYLPLFITTDSNELVMHYLVTSRRRIAYNSIKALNYPIVIHRNIYAEAILQNEKAIHIHYMLYIGLGGRLAYIKKMMESLQELNNESIIENRYRLQADEKFILTPDINNEFHPTLQGLFLSPQNIVILLMVALMAYRIYFAFGNYFISSISFILWLIFLLTAFTIVKVDNEWFEVSNIVYATKRTFRFSDIDKIVVDGSYIRIFCKSGKTKTYLHSFSEQQRMGLQQQFNHRLQKNEVNVG